MADFQKILKQLTENVEKELFKCTGCRQCLDVCPVKPEGILINQLNEATHTPDGANDLIKQFVKDCMQCNICEIACLGNVKRRQVMLLLKARMEKAEGYENFVRFRSPKMGVTGKLGSSILNIKKLKNAGRFRSKIDAKEHSKQKNLFFFGCHGIERKGLIEKAASIAEKIQMPFELVAGQSHCCGYRHYLAGDLESYEWYLSKLKNTIEKVEPALIICGCGECLAALNEIRKLSSVEKEFEVISISRWLHSVWDKIAADESFGEIAAVSSCRFRKGALDNPFDTILKETYKLVQRVDNDIEPGCCGINYFGKKSSSLTARIESFVQKAKETGAEALAVECVNCALGYEKAAAKNNFPVLHVLELVHKRAFEKREESD